MREVLETKLKSRDLEKSMKSDMDSSATDVKCAVVLAAGYCVARPHLARYVLESVFLYYNLYNICINKIYVLYYVLYSTNIFYTLWLGLPPSSKIKIYELTYK